MRRRHVEFAVGMAMVLGCGGDPVPTEDPQSSTGSASSSTTQTSSSTTPTSGGPSTSTVGSSSGAPASTSTGLTGSSGSDDSGGPSGSAGTSGSTGEPVTACGVIAPLLCEDFESADPLANWTVTETPGAEVTVEDSDPPNDPAVLRARSTGVPSDGVAEIRRLVDGVEGGLLAATVGAWIRFDATCIDAGDAPFAPLTLVFHLPDDPGGFLEVTASLVLHADGGELRLGSSFTHPILPFVDFSWAGPIAPDTWHHAELTLDLETRTAVVVFDRAVVIDNTFQAEDTEPLLPQVLAGLFVPFDFIAGDCSVRIDDIYVTDASDL